MNYDVKIKYANGFSLSCKWASSYAIIGYVKFVTYM